MIRRRLLLSMLNQFKYLPYSYEYIYYSLVPQTIDGKQVKNKARVNTIYGNSVVENQLSPLWVSGSNNGVDIVATNGGQGIILSGTTTGYLIYAKTLAKPIPIGHKVLVNAKVVNPNSVFFGYRLRNASEVDYSGNAFVQIYTATKEITQFQIYGDPNINYTGVEVNDDNIIDLTQMFPFDTPTTLTDNRVQKILNGGYIPYNSGKIKSVDISEISSEPYNLFDEETQVGDIDDSTGVYSSSGSRICSKNYINVLPNKSYYNTFPPSVGNYNKVYFYDENYSFISFANINSSSNNIDTPSNCFYIKFKLTTNYGTTYLNDISISLVNLGYKPHTSTQTLPFKYQGGGVGTSHDKMEITSSEVVFTKDQSPETSLSSFSWTAGSESRWFTYVSQINNMYRWTDNTKLANMLCSKYQVVNADSVQSSTGYNTIYQSGGLLFIKDSAITQASDITGTLKYQLATPQVIRIPRKHLGVVDLGSLDWQYSSSTQTFYVMNMDIANKGDTSIANIYCLKYMTLSPSDIVNNNKQGIGYSTNYYLRVRDTTYNNATDFKNAMSGVYLFYETEDEVADIDTQIGVESGGTLTTDSDVLTNAIFDFKAK